jgi:hypothetical protein
LKAWRLASRKPSGFFRFHNQLNPYPMLVLRGNFGFGYGVYNEEVIPVVGE